MKPRWSQDGPRAREDGHLGSQDGPRGSQDDHPEALWEAFLNIFGGLGTDLCREGRCIKSNTPTTFLVIFRTWRASCWRLFGAILGDLGFELGHLGRSCLPVRALLVDLRRLWLPVKTFLVRGVISGTQNWGDCLGLDNR